MVSSAESTASSKPKRRVSLDIIRGITLISMITYHAMWDLVYMYGVQAPWYRSTSGYLWQQSICWTFILLSGYCWGLGKRPLRRGIIVSLGGLLVTAVTIAVMPAQKIVFGVLTMTGASMLLMIPVNKLTRRWPAWVGLLISATLFFITRNVNVGELGFESIGIASLPREIYANLLTTFLGFPSPGFSSTDYFSLIPWFFLFAVGHFIRRLIPVYRSDPEKDTKKLPELLTAVGKPFAWLGRHSLLVYLLHQPVIYLVCELIF